MTRPNRVRPKSGERLGIGLGHMVGSSLGGLTRAAKPVPKPPVAPVPAQPVAPSGGGAPTAVARWRSTGTHAFGSAVTGFSLYDGAGDPIDDPIGPWDTYLEYNGSADIVIIADCWVQAMFSVNLQGCGVGKPYTVEGSAGDWGGISADTIAGSIGNAGVIAAGAVVFMPAADSPSIDVRAFDLASGGGSVGTVFIGVTVWAP